MMLIYKSANLEAVVERSEIGLDQKADTIGSPSGAKWARPHSHTLDFRPRIV